MSTFTEFFRLVWLSMVTMPWQRLPGKHNISKLTQIGGWTLGWAWSLAGLAFGALLAPYLMQQLPSTAVTYEDKIQVVIAVATGFLAQAVGWLLAFCIGVPLFLLVAGPRKRNEISALKAVLISLPFSALLWGAAALPIVALYYLYQLYISSSETASAGNTFVIATLVKVALILGWPIVKSLVVGLVLARVMMWLRGEMKK
jgi:hypothetical protein